MTVALSEAFRLLAFRAEIAFALTLSTIICINFVVCSVWAFRGNGGGRTPAVWVVRLDVLGLSAVTKFRLLRGIVFAKARVATVVP